MKIRILMTTAAAILTACGGGEEPTMTADQINAENATALAAHPDMHGLPRIANDENAPPPMDALAVDGRMHAMPGMINVLSSNAPPPPMDAFAAKGAPQ